MRIEKIKNLKKVTLGYRKINCLPYGIELTRVDCYARNGRRMDSFLVEESAYSVATNL